MSIFMITAGEVQFVKEIIYELTSLADPSEFFEEEVQQAYDILDKLTSYDTELLLSLYTNHINKEPK